MAKVIDLQWKRPESSEYPKVWHTFTVKSRDSDELVKYRVQDLPESGIQEALDIGVKYFCRDEPLSEALGIINDSDAVNDLVTVWKAFVNQKTVLVCVRDDTNEIVGFNMNYVLYKDEHFFDKVRKENKSALSNVIFETLGLMHENGDPCEIYGTDLYLSSAGLVVKSGYRGLGIGLEFVKARKPFCEEFGIKLASTIYTSNYSNHIADKAGYTTDVSMSFEDIRRNYPHLNLPKINSNVLTSKSFTF